jgi:hypothetical protein
MLITILLVLCLLTWFLLFVDQITRRGSLVFLIWLFIAPVVTNFVAQNGATDLFRSAGKKWEATADSYYTSATTISVYELLEPTRALFGLFLVIFLLDALLEKKRLLPLDKTEIRMSVFSLIVVANVLLRSKRLAFGLHVAVDAFLVPFLGYYLARRLVTSDDRFHQLTRAISYMGCYVIVMGLIERLTTPELLHRVRGPFEIRDVLYVVMAVVFCTVLLDWFGKNFSKKNQALPRSVHWFVLSLAPVIIALTLTRGNWVGFLIGVWVFLFLGRQSLHFAHKVGIIGWALILIPIIVIGLQLFVPKEFFAQRVGHIGNVHGRLATWAATIKQGAQAPLFGIGLNNLHGTLSKTKVRFGEAESFSTPHNSFFSLFVELGIVGLLAYLAIVRSIIQIGLKLYHRGTDSRDWWRGITIIAIMAAYHVPSLFTNLLYVTGLIHVYVYVLVGAIAGLYSKSHSIPYPHLSSAQHRQMGLDILAVTR